jgi:hypothetical protein
MAVFYSVVRYGSKVQARGFRRGEALAKLGDTRPK